MKLCVLADNNTIIDKYFLGEPGLSFFIEDEDKKILFDTGYSDVYARNAVKLGINLESVDEVVISHGHDDHTGGLKHLPERKVPYKVVAHSSVFEEKKMDNLKICSPYSKDEAAEKFELVLSDKPVKLSENITFLGQIPRITKFENVQPIGERLALGRWVSDFILDDSALVFDGKNGLVIITGCSHSGICNILEYAKKVTGKSRINTVIGGFHLMNVESDQLDETCDYFSKSGIKEIYPCHCTCFGAKAELNKVVSVKEVGVGLTFEWN